MRNKPISETDLLARVLQDLRGSLPSGWSVEEEPEPAFAITPGSRWRPDSLLKIRSPDGRLGRVIVGAKAQLEPKDVHLVLDQTSRYASAVDADGTLVAAPYLSRRAREVIAEAGSGYADATGNRRLVLSQPGLFLERPGAETNPWPEERALRSLKGPSAGRVVRALCDLRPPYGIRELAGRSDTSLASVARVVELLDREAIVVREPRGPVRSVDWRALIRRWTQDYSFARSNSTRTYLEPRGLPALRSKIASVAPRIAVTGSLAATELAGSITPPRLATLYVDSVLGAASVLDLREAETGGNVVLAEPFDGVVFDRTRTRDGVTFCSASQIAADLLTGPGRAPAEGEALLDWMKTNEDAWRS